MNWLYIILLLVCHPASAGSERDELRIDIGLSVFPRVLAVDNDFHHKLSSQNNVKLAFVYSHDSKKAKRLAQLMYETNAVIGDARVVAESIAIKQLLQLKPNEFSAFFIAEKLSDTEVAELIDLSINHSRVLFSPFSGDVERGVTVGIMITSRVWPYLNLQTIEESHIRLDRLLINYAKHYE